MESTTKSSFTKRACPIPKNHPPRFFDSPRLFLLMFAVVMILGCATLIPRDYPQEPASLTEQSVPIPTAIRPTPIPPNVVRTETQVSECTRLNLTSQECASLGQHSFTLTDVLDDGYCWYGADDKTVTRDLLVTVSFSDEGSGKTVKITNAAYIDCETSMQTAENTYAYDCMAQGNHDTGLITFVEDGFLNVGRFMNSVNKNCG